MPGATGPARLLNFANACFLVNCDDDEDDDDDGGGSDGGGSDGGGSE